MAFRQVQVYAYDVMDRIQVSVRYQEIDPNDEASSEWITVAATTIQSTGEPDGRAWVQDALIAALEVL